jgi:uncharacterized protein YdeI (YjbR/CyaY-like superfamily)
MKALIDSNKMTAHGLKYFDIKLLDNIDQMIVDDMSPKSKPVEMPEFFKKMLVDEHSLELFLNKTKSTQKMYIHYILDAKKDETKIRRCHKIIGILNGKNNNL